MAPRSIWNGTITFGLVNVPVKLYSATESKTVHFREVHAKDGSPIEHRRICPKDDKEIDYDDIVKGFEVSKGKWVELTDDEIAAAAGSQSRRIEIDHFVPFDEIDPDFCRRVDLRQLNKRALESLVKAGAMDGFGERAALLAGLDTAMAQG